MIAIGEIYNGCRIESVFTLREGYHDAHSVAIVRCPDGTLEYFTARGSIEGSFQSARLRASNWIWSRPFWWAWRKWVRDLWTR